MARSTATLLLLAALALAAATTLASARPSSSPSSSSNPAASAAGPPSLFSGDGADSDDFVESAFAMGCAGGLPPLLEFIVDRKKDKNDDDKPDKGFSCEGDKSGSGPRPSSSATRIDDLALSHARSLGWDLNSTTGDGVTRRSCWGTFRAYWRCPEHKDAGACLECKGHHSWLRAPCGAEIAVCDGLMHHFARFEKKHDERENDDDSSSTETWRVFFGAGSLGKSVWIKSPPEKEKREANSLAAEGGGEGTDDDVGRRRHRRRRDDDNGDDEDKWSKVRVQWSSEGLSGQAWTVKKIDGGWGNDDEDNAFDDIAAEARSALADAGLAVLPDRDSTLPSSSSSLSAEAPGFVRTLASRVASFFASRSLPFAEGGGGFHARGTCNGETPRWPGAPCKGEAKMEWEKGGARGSAVCDGFWSGSGRRTGNKCLGFSQLSASKGVWSAWKHCNGASATKRGGGSCPWHRDNGKKGMASWCHGGASGAIVKKPEGGRDDEEVVAEPQAQMITV